MKKLSLLLALFALALSFTSCDKEGVYNPNKKISKSYLDTSEGKQLTSTWNWDGKLLRTIDYHDLISGEIAYTNIFSYNDKDQIVSISDITNNEIEIKKTNGKIISVSQETFSKLLDEKCTLSANNVLYIKPSIKFGIIPKFLEKTYNLRKSTKKSMLNNKLKVKDLEEEISKLEAQLNDLGN